MSQENTFTESEKPQAPQSAFVQHLATYPAVTAVAGLVASFPVVKIFASNAVPLLQAVHERTRKVSDPLLHAVEPALKRADSLGDKVLSDLDTRFPALKTVQPADLVEGAQSRINSVRSSAQHTVDAHLIQPVANAAEAAKAQYTKVYDTQGRYITTIVNSKVSPVNDRIESAIAEYLPGEGSLSPSEGTEVQRTLFLVKTAAERARPQIEEFELSTRQYVVQVYHSKLKERDGDAEKHSLVSSLLAALSAGRQISGEGLSKAVTVARSSPKIQQAKASVVNTASAITESAGQRYNDVVASPAAPGDASTTTALAPESVSVVAVPAH